MTMNKEQIRQKILEFSLNKEMVEIPEWDTTVEVREMTGEDFVELSEKCVENTVFDKKKFFILSIIKSVFLENENVFTLEDYEYVKFLPVTIYSKFLTVISKLNNLDGDKKN